MWIIDGAEKCKQWVESSEFSAISDDVSSLSGHSTEFNSTVADSDVNSITDDIGNINIGRINTGKYLDLYKIIYVTKLPMLEPQKAQNHLNDFCDIDVSIAFIQFLFGRHTPEIPRALINANERFIHFSFLHFSIASRVMYICNLFRFAGNELKIVSNGGQTDINHTEILQTVFQGNSTQTFGNIQVCMR